MYFSEMHSYAQRLYLKNYLFKDFFIFRQLSSSRIRSVKGSFEGNPEHIYILKIDQESDRNLCEICSEIFKNVLFSFMLMEFWQKSAKISPPVAKFGHIPQLKTLKRSNRNKEIILISLHIPFHLFSSP